MISLFRSHSDSTQFVCPGAGQSNGQPDTLSVGRWVGLARSSIAALVVIALAVACGGDGGSPQDDTQDIPAFLPDDGEQPEQDIQLPDLPDEPDAPEISQPDLTPADLQPDETACLPFCDGRECGDDGCGGLCGTCAGDLVCLPEGLCVPAAASPSPGQLVITEIMADPAAVKDTDGEWFEIRNTTAVFVNLQGLEFSDAGTDKFTIDKLVHLGPNKHLVLGRNAKMSDNGGVTVGWTYSSFTLANDSDSIVMKLGETVIDAVVWESSWKMPSGASLSLSPDKHNAELNDLLSSWCASTSFIVGEAGDKGTPGFTNLTCDAQVCVPACDGKECGPNGCGGECGTCIPGTTCSGGLCLTQTGEAPAPGDFIINELMINPKNSSDTNGEWIELRNLTNKDLQLKDIVVQDLEGDSFVVAVPLTLPPNGFVVLGRNSDQEMNGGYKPDYVYTGFNMANTQDEVIILFDGQVIDQVQYDSSTSDPALKWQVPDGSSLALKPDVADVAANDVPGVWCMQQARMPLVPQELPADFATPGAANVCK